MSLSNNSVCCKDANLEAGDLRLLLILHAKNKGSLGGEELNFFKAEALEELDIKIIQVWNKDMCQYFKIIFITERRFMLEKNELGFS